MQANYAERVKTLLLRRRISITDFARKLRPVRHRNTVSQAIHHPDYFPHVCRQINRALGISE